jgi:hypothetical protein
MLTFHKIEPERNVIACHVISAHFMLFHLMSYNAIHAISINVI